MKKKLIFMALLTVLLAYCFLSCQEDPQKVIVVTGIPATTDYNYGFVGLSRGLSGNDIAAISLPVPITNGQITCDLLDEDGNAFTESGTYAVVLIILKDGKDVKSDVYNGIIASKKIEEEVTTLSYASFYGSKTSININLNQLLKK